MNVARNKNIAYALCGIGAALAGMVMLARLGTGEPTAGQGYELNAIAAAAIGGDQQISHTSVRQAASALVAASGAEADVALRQAAYDLLMGEASDQILARHDHDRARGQPVHRRAQAAEDGTCPAHAPPRTTSGTSM